MDKADRFCGLQLANREGVRSWLDVTTTLLLEHQYTPSHVYNADGSDFVVSANQSSRVLINIIEVRSLKQIRSRQEWITEMQCMGASGTAVPFSLSSKANDTNTSWVPTQTPLGWKCSTSNSGWACVNRGHEWLTTGFAPCTKPDDLSARRLLAMGGQGKTTKAFDLCM